MIFHATIILIFSLYAGLARCQYSVSECRPLLINNIISDSVTLQQVHGKRRRLHCPVHLRAEPIYEVGCARLGYFRLQPDELYGLYTVVKTNEFEFKFYSLKELTPGYFEVSDNIDENFGVKHLDGVTFHYILYHEYDVLLLYWCKDKAKNSSPDDNTWIIAAKTKVVGSEKTKNAVRQLLQDERYRKIIGNVLTDEGTLIKNFQIPPCEEEDLGLDQFYSNSQRPF